MSTVLPVPTRPTPLVFHGVVFYTEWDSVGQFWQDTTIKCTPLLCKIFRETVEQRQPPSLWRDVTEDSPDGTQDRWELKERSRMSRGLRGPERGTPDLTRGVWRTLPGKGVLRWRLRASWIGNIRLPWQTGLWSDLRKPNPRDRTNRTTYVLDGVYSPCVTTRPPTFSFVRPFEDISNVKSSVNLLVLGPFYNSL